MFYSAMLLSKKGPLGSIWVAAHVDRKLTKAKIAETDIKRCVG
jgi:cohesin complex subunit SCC1